LIRPPASLLVVSIVDLLGCNTSDAGHITEVAYSASGMLKYHKKEGCACQKQVTTSWLTAALIASDAKLIPKLTAYSAGFDEISWKR
jgi:hypothetical protein